MKFRNLRIGNGIELGKFQLYLLPRFCILPALWMLPGRRGSKVLGRLRSSPAGELQFPPNWQPVWLMLSSSLMPRQEALSRLALLGAVLQSEAVRGSLSFGELPGMQIAPRTRKNVATRTGDELSVNMPPSGMKEKNVCSGAAGGVYAGAEWPIRKADCEGGDGRDSP